MGTLLNGPLHIFLGNLSKMAVEARNTMVMLENYTAAEKHLVKHHGHLKWTLYAYTKKLLVIFKIINTRQAFK